MATGTAIATPNNSRMKEMRQSTGGDGDGNYDGAAVDRMATATPSNSRTREWRSESKTK